MIISFWSDFFFSQYFILFLDFLKICFRMAIPTQFSATDLETAFLLMDKSFDGRASGKITVEKLRAVYEGFGQECPTDEELERMISVVR